MSSVAHYFFMAIYALVLVYNTEWSKLCLVIWCLAQGVTDTIAMCVVSSASGPWYFCVSDGVVMLDTVSDSRIKDHREKSS